LFVLLSKSVRSQPALKLQVRRVDIEQQLVGLDSVAEPALILNPLSDLSSNRGPPMRGLIQSTARLCVDLGLCADGRKVNLSVLAE
jgi:hypothetical protein